MPQYMTQKIDVDPRYSAQGVNGLSNIMAQAVAPQVVKPRASNADMINALKQSFATTVKKVFINSFQREVGFREITVLEQKQLSRIMIDNEQRKDIIYDAQCALLNKICLDDTFDIYNATEFDKIKLLIAVYQSNMFKNEIAFTCKNCGAENKYKLDFQEVFQKLDTFDITDKKFHFENDSWEFDFIIGYPTVKRVSQFYKDYTERYRTASYKEIEAMNEMMNADYATTFMKSVQVKSKSNGNAQTLDFGLFSTKEVETTISLFPQDVMYADDGVLNFITTQFIERINKQFEQHACAQCGTIENETIGQDVSSFL